MLRPMMLSDEILQQLGADGWQTTHDGLLMCPCGHRVELDGSCPNGHESPLRSAGLI